MAPIEQKPSLDKMGMDVQIVRAPKRAQERPEASGTLGKRSSPGWPEDHPENAKTVSGQNGHGCPNCPGPKRAQERYNLAPMPREPLGKEAAAQDGPKMAPRAPKPFPDKMDMDVQIVRAPRSYQIIAVLLIRARVFSSFPAVVLRTRCEISN